MTSSDQRRGQGAEADAEVEAAVGVGVLGGEAAALLADYRRSIDPPAGASGALWAGIEGRVELESEERPRIGRGLVVTIAIAAAVLLGIAAQLGGEVGRGRAGTAVRAPYSSEGARSRGIEARGPGVGSERGIVDEGAGAGAGDPAADGREGATVGDAIEDRGAAAMTGGGGAAVEDRGATAPASERRPVDRSRRGSVASTLAGAVSDADTDVDADGEADADAEVDEGVDAGADSLVAEMALITAAEAALRRGDAGRALEILDRHRARFPAGELTPEREASRISALCAEGRGAEAEAAARVFLGRWPGSHLARRVSESCGGG